MKSDPDKANNKSAPLSLWITLEAEEVIELKRISLDRDEEGALVFFRDVLASRVSNAARQRGIAADLLKEMEADEHLPG